MIEYFSSQRTAPRSELPPMARNGLDWAAGKTSPEIKLRAVFYYQFSYVPLDIDGEAHYYSVSFYTNNEIGDENNQFAYDIDCDADISISQRSDLKILRGHIYFVHIGSTIIPAPGIEIISPASPVMHTVVLELFAIEAWSRFTRHLYASASVAHKMLSK